MKILIVTQQYPTKHRERFPFVKQLVEEFCRQGHVCFVVVPYNVSSERRTYKLKEVIEYHGGGKEIIVRPNYVSFSDYTVVNRWLSSYAWWNAFKRGLSCVDEKMDVVYCHFWQSMKAGMVYAKKFNVPLFVANGESRITDLYPNFQEERDLQKQVRGVVCVSTKSKEESLSLNLTTEDKCFVSPNAINNKLFRKLDKSECRRKLNIEQNAFIVVSVGAFIERKGLNRVAKVIDSIDEEIFSIFIGKGPEEPMCKNIIYKGTLAHKDVPIFLNASDIFVLPTMNEGCCNAVVEAMACGLPIISSNMSFNWDVLNSSNSLLVDPKDEGAIAQAIKKLYNDVALRESLGRGALYSAEKLSISERANNIIAFINSMM